jgi:hypothetical protein
MPFFKSDVVAISKQNDHALKKTIKLHSFSNLSLGRGFGPPSARYGIAKEAAFGSLPRE